jgi:hypothetical protein
MVMMAPTEARRLIRNDASLISPYVRFNLQRTYFIASRPSLMLTILGLLTASSGNTASSNVVAPGEEKTATTRTLDAGAALLQSRQPIDALNTPLDGFHFYNGHPGVQMEAHHYCSILN